MTKKTIQDLTIKEIAEDLDYWIIQTMYRAPPMLDEMFVILNSYVKELLKRVDKK